MDKAVLNELLRESDIVFISPAVRLDPGVMYHHGTGEADAAKLGFDHVADYVFSLFLHGGGLVFAFGAAFSVHIFVQSWQKARDCQFIVFHSVTSFQAPEGASPCRGVLVRSGFFWNLRPVSA